MFDSIWDLQLLSDGRVIEQSDLEQREAVGGHPVREHRLRRRRRNKQAESCSAQKHRERLTGWKEPDTELTVGKLMVKGRMIKGMTLNTVFMARRLGLSTPDSAPSWRKVARSSENKLHSDFTLNSRLTSRMKNMVPVTARGRM